MITWTPVSKGFTHSETHTRVTSQIEIASEDGAEMFIREWWSNPDGAARIWYRLPPDIRLCRAVAAPTWSQEPPDAPGDWWCWIPGDKYPRIARVAAIDDDTEHWSVYYGGLASLIYRNKPTRNRWWCKATVPQPPGEVGP